MGSTLVGRTRIFFRVAWVTDRKKHKNKLENKTKKQQQQSFASHSMVVRVLVGVKLSKQYLIMGTQRTVADTNSCICDSVLNKIIKGMPWKKNLLLTG